MADIKAHLKRLSEAHAPSGHEAPIRAILRDAWEPLTDSLTTDRLGSLIGIKRGTTPEGAPRRTVMLAAHMDEIGMIVREIRDGFIMVARVGGTDNRVMLAQPVLVHGTQTLPGVVAAVPPHLLSEDDRKKYPGWDSLVIDVGLPAEQVAEMVTIGDLVTSDAPLVELINQRVAGKAFDDRACVAIVTATLENLQKMRHTWDVAAVATVQEETGLFGASTAAYQVHPDIAVALDVGFAKQPGVESPAAAEFNGGPQLGIGPNFHDGMNDRLREIAKRHDIKIQDESLPGNSGTDAWAIQIANEGIPCALFSLPIRNMHSTVETLDLRDIDRTARLLAHFIVDLDDSFMDILLGDDLPATTEEEA